MERVLILCEGNDSSFDHLILSKILGDNCRVFPLGSRFGMKYRIDTIRHIYNDKAFSLLDRDFPEDWHEYDGELPEWRISENGVSTHYGWYWPKKEIENYLLDPVIIKKSLGLESLPWADYDIALKKARDKIGVYEAARIALSGFSRKGQYYVPMTCGKGRGSNNKYQFPDETFFTEKNCENWLEQIHKDYRERHSLRYEKLVESFHRYKKDCTKGGVRYQQFMSAFSGKDIAWSLSDWFKEVGFVGTKHFLRLVVAGIIASCDNVSNWHGDWNLVHSCIVNEK